VIDIKRELAAIGRFTGPGRVPAGEGRTVQLTRTYDAPVEEVWDAITDPERISRWFLPVTGDFRLGGSYQLKGNAGGEIRRCEPPRLLAVTWIFGEQPTEEDSSVVEVRLTPGEGDTTVFELNHTAIVPPEMWDVYGPGAVGVGWDGGLLGLSLHLAGNDIDEAEKESWAMATSAEAQAFLTGSSEAWGAAYEASGATKEQVSEAVKNTTAFYVPPAG